LIRDMLPVSAISTHRSRGNDSTAARLAAGSTRMIMIVSLRSPIDSRSPNPPAYGESGSMHAPLSAPVIKKFWASGSGAGNVDATAVEAVVARVVEVRATVVATAAALVTITSSLPAAPPASVVPAGGGEVDGAAVDGAPVVTAGTVVVAGRPPGTAPTASAGFWNSAMLRPRAIW